MNIPQVKSVSTAEIGEMGQRYLAAGKQVGMRLWEEKVGDFCEPRGRNYETVGYLLSGTLELDLDGQSVTLHGGDSWLVPEGAIHRYRVERDIVAIEATSPPARFNDRDESVQIW